MSFVCGAHRAYVYHLGGERRVAELPKLSMVRWRRVRDDTSTAEVTVPSSDCCEILADLRTIENELHIYRNGEVVWQGPITRIEYEDEVTRIFAEDILWQSTRCVVSEGYDQSYPNIWNVIDRMNWLLHHCYDRFGNIWNVGINPIYGPDDPRTTRIVFAWQMYVWDDLDKYAEDYGADYTVYNRDVYFWDISLKWLIIPNLDESHLTQLPRIVEYGNQLGTRGIVTNGRGWAGVSAVTPGSQERYGTIIDWLTTNEIDGQPGTEEQSGDPDITDVPTPEELGSWADTATRSIVERFPSPLAIVIPANTTLLPGAPWEISDMVPGAWFQVTTTRLCRQVSEWQRLQEVVVTEEAPNGETIQFSAVSAPAHPLDPIGQIPNPPSVGPAPPIPPAVPCVLWSDTFTTISGWQEWDPPSHNYDGGGAPGSSTHTVPFTVSGGAAVAVDAHSDGPGWTYNSGIRVTPTPGAAQFIQATIDGLWEDYTAGTRNFFEFSVFTDPAGSGGRTMYFTVNNQDMAGPRRTLTFGVGSHEAENILNYPDELTAITVRLEVWPSGRTRLYRDGVLKGDYTDAPPPAGNYQALLFSWDNQFEDPPVTESPRILSVSGGCLPTAEPPPPEE